MKTLHLWGWQIAASLLIALSGWWGAHVLTKVDQDIRVIYSEYTLAATDLGHMNARLIRYRTTSLRAIEANTKQQFESIYISFPAQLVYIQATLDRYAIASEQASSNSEVKTREKAALMEFREKLVQYIDASHLTLNILRGVWDASSTEAMHHFREQAEYNAATNAGPKLIAVSFALDRLLEIVGEIAGDARKEAESILRVITSSILGVTLGLAALVLLVPRGTDREGYS